ncbi:MAG TPA: type IV secretion system protein [Streptosporangiaceae bacterium]
MAAVLVTLALMPRSAGPGQPLAHAHKPDTAAVVLTAAVTGQDPSSPGGLCSVPGIGDIGGLLGFCTLGSSGLIGDINNVCQPSLPEPTPANDGIDAMVAPPSSGKAPATLYDEYGVAGNYWAATNLQCSDMTSLIGNNVAGMVFDAAKSIDRVTITVYQSAAGEGIVGWLQRVTDTLITSLGRAIYFPYLSIVVILAAIWLAWQGLIRKRATRTIEGTVWMIGACAAAIFLIGAPAQVTGAGKGVTAGISQALNAAFAKLPSPGPSGCVPVQKGDPEVQPAVYSYTSGGTVVDQNADELWSVLVCKPWLVGEFGTSVYTTGKGNPTVVNTYGRSLLWSQAIAADEKATPALIQAKQSAFQGIAANMQAKDPAIYPLFQGKEWTTRLEVAFAALFAALVAGVLVLLISVTLILLKLSFLLLLIVGPFFLLVGVHPGFGRIVALRWLEMLVGVLLKQAAVALVLSLLLYCYALIMGTSDAVLPWALKILMIALVTVAAFVYRKPFQHLFSAVGYGMMGSPVRAETDLARAAATARANSMTAATAFPAFAAYRAARWARRNPGQAARVAVAASGGGVAAGAAAAASGLQASAAAEAPAKDGTGAASDAAAVPEGSPGRTVPARVRAGATTVSAPAAEPPPLNLPSRTGVPSSAGSAAGRAMSVGAAGRATGAGADSARTPVPPPAPGTWPTGRTAGTAGRMTGRQPGGAPPRQPDQGARVRVPQAPSAPGRRPPESSGGRQRSALRGQSAAGRPQSDRSEPAAGPPALWQGQRMTGPLARQPELPERPVPFWLRPMRRR